MFGPDLGL
jgi:ABC-type transport system involved in cytochrome c biogenesis permease subunit